MEKIIKNLSKILSIVSIALLPFIGLGLLFGLAGSTSQYFTIMLFGYIGIIIFSIISIFKYKFFSVVIISAIVFFIGFTLNANFWEKHNDQLCEDLRANPTCVEDACGFRCSDFGGEGFGFTTGGGICKDKDMNLCVEKMKESTQEEKETQDALVAYSNIVDKIVESSSPQNEDFEIQLVAIYNCLEEKYGPGAEGELMAVRTLTQKNLSQAQLNKYYAYLSSKGRNVNVERIVAGLPAGDKNLSCKDVNY